jgi:hypothetical protein
MTRRDGPLFAGSVRNGSTELSLITGGIVLFCVLGAISSLGPAAARFVDTVFAVLASAVVVALGVAAVRRDLRIRRRLAAIEPLTPEEAAQRRPRYRVEERGRAA